MGIDRDATLVARGNSYLRNGKACSASGSAMTSKASTVEKRSTHREDTMASLDASTLGGQLDKDHLPETNGRMSICRRCGATTDGPMGHCHLPSERQAARARRWLDEQARLHRVEQARGRMS
jgi:hypothetical protein